MNRNNRRKDVIWVVVLAALCGLLIWHIVHWYSTGVYREMLDWAGTDRAYVLVLYNLGLMLGLGAVLGFLLDRITSLSGYRVRRIKHFDEEKEDSGR